MVSRDRDHIPSLVIPVFASQCRDQAAKHDHQRRVSANSLRCAARASAELSEHPALQTNMLSLRLLMLLTAAGVALLRGSVVR